MRPGLSSCLRGSRTVSVPPAGAPRARAPQEVQADLEDVLRLLAVGRERSSETDDAGGRPADEVVCVVAEPVMVILDEAGDPVGEGILGADSDCPTTPGVAGQIGDRAVREEEGEIVSLPGCAALHVAEEAIPEGIADAAGQRGEILGVETAPHAAEDDQVGFVVAGPVIYALDANHPSAGKPNTASALPPP